MTTAIPLASLAQQIAQQQAELETLHADYETRKIRLADLALRKKKLEAKLNQIEAEIQALNQGKKTRLPSPSEVSQASVAVPARSARSQTLPDFLVDRVRQAKTPLTAAQLAEEVKERDYPTSSQNIRRLIETRIRELVAKGILSRVQGQAGVVLAKPNDTKPKTRISKAKAGKNDVATTHKPKRKKSKS